MKKLSRSSRSEVLCKNTVSKNVGKFTEKHLRSSPFLLKLHVWATDLLKRTSSQVLSNEFLEIFQNSYSKEHLRMAASEDFLRKLALQR